MLSWVRRWHVDEVDDTIAQCPWRAVCDELDVLNVGSGCELPWRDHCDTRTASVDSGVNPDADPDKHGDQTQSRPIPAKIFNSDFYSDELALTLYCRQPACLTWWYYNFALHYKNRQLFGIFNIKLEAEDVSLLWTYQPTILTYQLMFGINIL
jgi:hypothetical protein